MVIESYRYDIDVYEIIMVLQKINICILISLFDLLFIWLNVLFISVRGMCVFNSVLINIHISVFHHFQWRYFRWTENYSPWLVEINL